MKSVKKIIVFLLVCAAAISIGVTYNKTIVHQDFLVIDEVTSQE